MLKLCLDGRCVGMLGRTASDPVHCWELRAAERHAPRDSKTMGTAHLCIVITRLESPTDELVVVVLMIRIGRRPTTLEATVKQRVAKRAGVVPERLNSQARVQTCSASPLDVSCNVAIQISLWKIVQGLLNLRPTQSHSPMPPPRSSHR